MLPSSSGLGRPPLTWVTGVRIPLGAPPLKLNISMNKILTLMVALLIAACNPASTISNKKSAVVAIGTEKMDDKGGLGTGWLLKENYIVTNYHVIEDAKKIMVASENGDMDFEAEFVYGDMVADLAVIRLKDWTRFARENSFQYLKFVEREDIRTAETVYAIGHPWGLFWTVSKGIISSEMRRSNEAPGFYLQTDAHVFNGNSGGPLLNEDGNLIGVNNAMIVNTGGSFGVAIPAPMVRKVLQDLERYKEVRWCSIGVSLSDDLTIKDVTKDRPAAKAGMIAGDRITEIHVNDRTVRARTTDQVISEINLCDQTQSIEIAVQRNDAIIKIKVQPGYKLSSEYKKLNVKRDENPKVEPKPAPEK